MSFPINFINLTIGTYINDAAPEPVPNREGSLPPQLGSSVEGLASSSEGHQSQVEGYASSCPTFSSFLCGSSSPTNLSSSSEFFTLRQPATFDEAIEKMTSVISKSKYYNPLQFSNNRIKYVEIIGKGENGQVACIADRAAGLLTKALKLPNSFNELKSSHNYGEDYALNLSHSHLQMIEGVIYVDDQNNFHYRRNKSDDPGMRLYGSVAEFYEGKPLCSNILVGNAMEPQLLKRLVQQVGSAIAYLHLQRFVHRDIKIDNIIESSQYNYTLIDCGLLTSLDKSEEIKTPLVNGYTCPESFVEEAQNIDARKRDVFAFGITLAEAALGRQLFNQEEYAQYKAIMENSYYQMPDTSLVETKVSPIEKLDLEAKIPGFLELISNATNIDPKRRSTIDEMLAAAEQLGSDTETLIA